MTLREQHGSCFASGIQLGCRLAGQAGARRIGRMGCLIDCGYGVRVSRRPGLARIGRGWRAGDVLREVGRRWLKIRGQPDPSGVPITAACGPFK